MINRKVGELLDLLQCYIFVMSDPEYKLYTQCKYFYGVIQDELKKMEKVLEELLEELIKRGGDNEERIRT
jgi:hypothetical protein